MAESAASGPLHKLQSEVTGAKSQWEYLHDRLTNGYKDAYKLHVGALKAMQNAKLLDEQREAKVRGVFMFVASVVAVGYAGGFVGGLFSPWVREAGNNAAKVALREGVKGMASESSKQVVRLVVPPEAEKPKVSDAEYLPVSPDPIDVYFDQKEELDGCFAVVNARLQQVIDGANQGQWSIDSGTAVLENFRKNCPLLTDAPDPGQLPGRKAIADAAELLMWVAWADARDWAYWNKVYDHLENNDDHLSRFDLDGVSDEWALGPVLDRLDALGVQSVDRGERVGSTYTRRVLDLRKLRSLPVQGMPTLPFTKMKGLHITGMDNLQLRGQFLDGLRDLRPGYIH